MHGSRSRSALIASVVSCSRQSDKTRKRPLSDAQESDLAARVAAVYTWGQPRVGDATFRERFDSAYGDRAFRIRNSGGIPTTGSRNTNFIPFIAPKLLRDCRSLWWLQPIGTVHVCSALSCLCRIDLSFRLEVYLPILVLSVFVQVTSCPSCCHNFWATGACFFFQIFASFDSIAPGHKHELVQAKSAVRCPFGPSGSTFGLIVASAGAIRAS